MPVLKDFVAAAAIAAPGTEARGRTETTASTDPARSKQRKPLGSRLARSALVLTGALIGTALLAAPAAAYTQFGRGGVTVPVMTANSSWDTITLPAARRV